MRRLKAQWMIDGPGGYVVRRIDLPIPSLVTVLLVLAFIAYALEIAAWMRR